MKYLLLSLLLINSSFANAGIRAYLEQDDYDCSSDHMVFESSYGYILAQWYGGTLNSGNFFYADFNSYGFKDVYSNLEDSENEENSRGRIWIDDYMVGQSDAKRWCNE